MQKKESICMEGGGGERWRSDSRKRTDQKSMGRKGQEYWGGRDGGMKGSWSMSWGGGMVVGMMR